MTTVSDLGGRLDWRVRRLTTWFDTFTVTDDDGAAVNITGWTIDARVTTSLKSPTALKTFSVSMINPAGGKFRISIDETAADLAVGTFWWSLQALDGGGDLMAWLWGKFVVEDWPR